MDCSTARPPASADLEPAWQVTVDLSAVPTSTRDALFEFFFNAWAEWARDNHPAVAGATLTDDAETIILHSREAAEAR